MYAIDEYDVPQGHAHSFGLRWRGLPPLRVLAAGLGAFALVCNLVAILFVPISGDWTNPRPMVWAQYSAPLQLALFAVVCVLGSASLRMLAAPEQVWYVARLTWEARDRVLVIRRQCAIPLITRVARIPFEEIERVGLEWRQSGHRAEVLLFLRCAGLRAVREEQLRLVLSLRVRGLPPRDGARDLGERVRIALGWGGMTVVRQDPAQTHLVLSPAAQPVSVEASMARKGDRSPRRGRQLPA